MATIKILLRKNKKKDGLIPVYLRITKDRKAKFISTGIRVCESDWDEVNFKVKKSRTNYKQMNATLSQKVAEAENLSLNLESKSPTVTSRIIKEKLKGSKSSNFFDFCGLILKEYIGKEMIGTHDKAHAIINKLKDFNGSGHLIFNDLTPNFLEKYDAHCRKKWENKTNTVLKDMKFIRKVVNDAIRQDLMEMHNNPFLKYKMRSEKTNRTFLTEEELQAIAKVNLTPGTRMELHRDMFIFSAYAGGLRVSDMLLLKWKNVDKTHINFVIRKTQEQISIKMPDVALTLIDKYRGKKQVPENYVFPMLRNGLDEDDFRLMDNEISSATSYINKNLKLIAKKIELAKPLSFHISRHTFATRALRLGVSIDKVSKLMGHSAIRETQVYAKLVSTELDKAMDVFNK